MDKNFKKTWYSWNNFGLRAKITADEEELIYIYDGSGVKLYCIYNPEEYSYTFYDKDVTFSTKTLSHIYNFCEALKQKLNR